MRRGHRGNTLVLAALVAAAAFLAGCAGPAPKYAPSIDNVEGFKKSGASALKTGKFGVKQDIRGANSISLRASSMVSPVGDHYGDYLSTALRQELELAGLFNPQSGVEIAGVLLENNIDAGGIRTNEGQMQARFVVTSKGQTRYDKVKRIEHQWEGSFAGAVAIPAAQNNYPIMVQKLIGSFIGDPDFVKALRD